MKFIFLSILFVFILVAPVYAKDDTEAIKSNVDKQNSMLMEYLKNLDQGISNGDDFDKLMEKANNAEQKFGTFASLSNVGNNILLAIFRISMIARKYALPTFAVSVVGSTMLLLFMGGKNLSNRKKYLFFLICSVPLLLILLNIPIIIIWFNSEAGKQSLLSESILNSMFDFLYWIRNQSWTIALFALPLGYIYKILGNRDIAKQIFGNYIIKATLISLCVAQIVPPILKLLI